MCDKGIRIYLLNVLIVFLELPRLVNARNHGNTNRLSLAMDMIRRSNEILRRLENPRTTVRAADADQLPEGQQQTEEISRNVPPETSGPELQTDPDSMNLYVNIIM